MLITITLTAIGVIAGILICLWLFSDPLSAFFSAVAIIGFFVFIGAISDFNGGMFDITKNTPQEIANPPQNHAVKAASKTRQATKASHAKAKATTVAKAKAKTPKRTAPKAVLAESEPNPYTIAISE